MAIGDGEREFHGLAVHQFRAPRTGIHVAMDTGDVAEVAQVELQRVEGAALDRREGVAGEQGADVVHGSGIRRPGEGG